MDTVSLTREGIQELGKRLRFYRESLGWSQREACRYIKERTCVGLTPSALGRIEEGSAFLKTDTMLMLAQINYGGMGFSEMVDIATGRRLSLCEKPAAYRV